MKSLVLGVTVCCLLSVALATSAQKSNRKGRAVRKHDRSVRQQDVRLNQANAMDSVPMQSTFRVSGKNKKKVAIVPMPATPPPMGPPVVPPKREP